MIYAKPGSNEYLSFRCALAYLSSYFIIAQHTQHIQPNTMSSKQLFLTIALLVTTIAAKPQFSDTEDLQQIQQYEKSVKGGRGGNFRYNAEANLNRFFGNNTRYRNLQSANSQIRPTPEPESQVGVCYIEVPTSELVDDPTRVPVGNGSRPDLSRIRACCKGYKRNIHNYRICEPFCSIECVNALCTAPDVCTCYPDHVKNMAGTCVATCPIGCQNGRCTGKECICNDGYTLNPDRQYCVPTCKRDCSGFGKCTLPNVCECKTGYAPGEEGACLPVCGPCEGGDCIAPGQCRCRQGYESDHKGSCHPVCAPDCPPGKCRRPNVCDIPPISNVAVPKEPFIPNQSLYGFGNRQNLDNQRRLANGSTDLWDDLRNPTVVVNQQSIYPSLQTSNLETTCSLPCVNGVCRSGRCNCNPGYVMDVADSTGSRCVPHCPGGCVNGICSSPNFCICNMGYVKDHSVKGRPACIKRA